MRQPGMVLATMLAALGIDAAEALEPPAWDRPPANPPARPRSIPRSDRYAAPPVLLSSADRAALDRAEAKRSRVAKARARGAR